MNILDKLINENRKEYLCFSMLRELYTKNEEFKKIIDEGYLCGEIFGFSEELWQKIDDQNMRGNLKSFEDVFRAGANIGTCTPSSKQLSFSFRECTLCSGLLPFIKGTKGSEEGEHSWMRSNGIIYDTSLMLCMTDKFANKLGYQTEVELNPHFDEYYSAAYDYANDPYLKPKKR